MQIEYYPQQVMKYLQTLPHSGLMPVDNITIFMSESGALSKQVIIRLYLKINNGIINKVSYLVYGDGYVIAALAKLAEDLAGVKLKSALNYNVTRLLTELEIPAAKAKQLKHINYCLLDIGKQYKSQHS